MSRHRFDNLRIAGVATCVPDRLEDNLAPDLGFDPVEARKVVQMAGVRTRPVVDDRTTAGDLCETAARALLDQLGWTSSSITGLIVVTQSPDYLLPSTSCVLHERLGLPDTCAAFDIGLGCSGYPYGLYAAAAMMHGGGHERILMLHGETPSRFAAPDDHATRLLFGDAGSVTALERRDGAAPMHFCLHTDGSGHQGLIIPGGAFRNRRPTDPRDLCVTMDGAGIFNFTIKRVPALIDETLAWAGVAVDQVDAYVFHQSNRFIMKHLAKKSSLPEGRVPMIIETMGNCGGPSVPLTLTQTQGLADRTQALTAMMIGYGVGLSWGSALVTLDVEAPLLHAKRPSGLHAAPAASRT
jgi:3-oxoacyl-[acyl-carrier-protein] synthase III